MPIPDQSRGHVFDFGIFQFLVIPACPESGKNLEFMCRAKRRTFVRYALALLNKRFLHPILGVARMTIQCNIAS